MNANLGGGEIVLLVLLALIVFGPRRLPQISRKMGEIMGQFRKASQDFKNTLDREVYMSELKDTGRDLENAGREIESEARGIARGSILDPSAADRPESEKGSPVTAPANTPTEAAPDGDDREH